MKTKQIFSIMVLVGIAFAGIAFAGPSALPPNKNVGAPIVLSPAVNQSKLGLPATGAVGYKVPHALSIGSASFPASDSTLHVEGSTTVGSLSTSNDITRVNASLQVGNSLTVNDTDPLDATKQSNFSVIDIATVKNSNTIKSLCVNSSNKVVICSNTPTTTPALAPAITSFTKSGNSSTAKLLSWTSVNTTSCSLERIDPQSDPTLVNLILAPNGTRNVTLIGSGTVYELTCGNGSSSVTAYLKVN